MERPHSALLMASQRRCTLPPSSSRTPQMVSLVWQTRLLIGLVAIAALPDVALVAIADGIRACLDIPQFWIQGAVVPRAIAFEPRPAPSSPDGSAAGVMTVGITFDLPPPAANIQPDVFPSTDETPPATAQPEGKVPPLANPPELAVPYDLNDLFVGGADSLVARAVGSAEGTRTPDGQRTSAYIGHVDPGNGVWNLGTFSYQHGATSPEEADAKQLMRLRQQATQLRQRAAQAEIPWGLREELNGIDLANQSPLAALQRGGYVDRLAEAQHLGLVGADAILWARTRSYLDPDTQRWNAPGLGNNLQQISRDQARRMAAIEQAIRTPPESSG